ncbi:hypothetical protein Q7P36_008690 [Cladosporium allicinum]
MPAITQSMGRGTAQITTTRGIQIHPIFSPDKFSPELDYATAFQEAALLASRLLATQQSYHWLFALCFGKNKTSRVPWEFRKKYSPNVPEEYNTNRAVGELTQHEVEAVDEQLTALSRRVQIKVPLAPFSDTAIAKCQPGNAEGAQQGCPSTILISRDFYDLTIFLGEYGASGPRCTSLFTMATTLLHEMAHAASFHIMGRRHEDFFEDALVAEAGFDYVSRIFGMSPIIPRLRHLCGAWTQWQNITFLSQKSYPVNRTCRNSKKLSMYPMRCSFDADYAKRLLSNGWWEGAEDRSVHLIPSFLLNPKNAQLLATTPVSFRRWLELIDSGVLNTSNPRLRPEATTTPLRIRQPTTDTSVYQFDQHHELEGGALFSYPYRFPESTESIRRVFPAHGGIDNVTLRKRFQLPSSPSQVQLYSELVREACRFSDASGRWFLKKKQKSLPVRYFNPSSTSNTAYTHLPPLPKLPFWKPTNPPHENALNCVAPPSPSLTPQRKFGEPFRSRFERFLYKLLSLSCC